MCHSSTVWNMGKQMPGSGNIIHKFTITNLLNGSTLGTQQTKIAADIRL